MSAPTEAQHKVLRFLLDHPGMGVFDYYDYIRGGSFGMERVAVRGAAGRMRHRLHDAGWLELKGRNDPDIVTAAGEEAIS